MDSQESLGLRLHQVATSLAHSSDEILLSSLGIGFSQFKVLYVLQSKPNIRQKEIALELGQTEASISRQLKKMYNDGLIITKVHPTNRREHITMLTKRGERICQQSIKALNRHHQQFFARLDVAQQDQLVKLLAQL
jgi:DNA-binding MarR family transcriptional regulator